MCKKLIELLKSNFKIFLVTSFFVFIVISLPIIINTIGNNRVFYSQGQYGEWLSFFGSYFGGIISGVLTLGGVYWAFALERMKRKKERLYLNHESVNNILYWCQLVIEMIETFKDIEVRNHERIANLHEQGRAMSKELLKIDVEYYKEMRTLITEIHKAFTLQLEKELTNDDLDKLDKKTRKFFNMLNKEF